MSAEDQNYFQYRSPDKIYGLQLKHSGLLGDIKNKSSFKELCAFCDDQVNNKPLSEKVYGNPLPKTYEDLGRLAKGVKTYIPDTLA
jgi:hypothetical protein